MNNTSGGGWGNKPYYDEKGRQLWYAETWRIPLIPFSRPRCCGQKAHMIKWNVYRCKKCATRICPERLWHRLMLSYNPFGPTSITDLFRTVRWVAK